VKLPTNYFRADELCTKPNAPETGQYAKAGRVTNSTQREYEQSSTIPESGSCCRRQPEHRLVQRGR